MKSAYELLPLIEYIKNKESNRYGLDINIESPTFWQYYKNHIKNNNLDFSETISRFLSVLSSSGYADDETGEVFVFNRNYALEYKFANPFDYLGIANLNDVFLSMVAFHEIRHIIQAQKFDIFDEYEFFCINYLKVLNHKYMLNTEFHDSQYFEIDANLYGVSEAKEIFAHNKKISKFLDKQIAQYTYQKTVYEFEEFLRYFSIMMKKGEYIDSYNGDDFLGTFWNSDGSFKSVSEMIDNPQFLYGGLLESRIMTSDVCLE